MCKIEECKKKMNVQGGDVVEVAVLVAYLFCTTKTRRKGKQFWDVLGLCRVYRCARLVTYESR